MFAGSGSPSGSSSASLFVDDVTERLRVGSPRRAVPRRAGVPPPRRGASGRPSASSLGSVAARVLPPRRADPRVDQLGGAVARRRSASLVIALAAHPRARRARRAGPRRRCAGSWIAQRGQDARARSAVVGRGARVAWSASAVPEVFRDLVEPRPAARRRPGVDPRRRAHGRGGGGAGRGPGVRPRSRRLGFAVVPDDRRHQRARGRGGADHRRVHQRRPALDAVVVAFDPDRDLAVLRRPGSAGCRRSARLTPTGGDDRRRVRPPRRRTAACRAGADRRRGSSRVGTDIYRTATTRRDVLVLAAQPRARRLRRAARRRRGPRRRRRVRRSTPATPAPPTR